MERFSEHDELAVALAELRPTPEAEFAAELDAWVTAGCPSRSRARRLLPLSGRLCIPSPRRLAYGCSTVAVMAIAVATALISTTDSGNPARMAIDRSSGGSLLNAFSGPVSGSSSSEGESAVEAQAAFPSSGRAIERSAQVVLLADPEDVADDSAQVFAAVHAAHGIVLRSNTTRGPAGRAGATFALLIPSARLRDALAAISAIDEVGSRHDATADITAPTVAVGERLADSRAKIDSLLAQLAAAETEAERETLEVQLRSERRQAAQLQAQLDRLHKRTHYSHVSVRIETGDSSTSPGGTWSIDDAFYDAGHILAVAAGVTLVGLAVLAPIALLILLVWLAHRTWLRIRRERALSRRV